MFFFHRAFHRAAKVLIQSDSDGTNKKSQKASKKKQLEETQLRDLTKVDLMVPINLDPIHWRGKRSIGILGHLNVLLKMLGQIITSAHEVVLLSLSKWL